MKAKIDDVAKMAGVSKTTVSRVLNQRGYLSKKTINKVHEAMDKLNYHPNVVARQLFKQETKLIGLIFPTVNNPFFGQLVASMEKRLFNKGFKVLIGNSMNDPEKEKLYLQQLMAHQVDGLIVGAHNSGIEEYENSNLPIIAVDRIVNPDIPIISSDNYQGGKIATELLIHSGAKTIIHTNDPSNLTSPGQKRREAYLDTMKQNGLNPIIYPLDFNLESYQKVKPINDMFKKYPNVDGIFASNDMDASQIIEIAKNKGYRIPNDLKVVGYDGSDITKILAPNLTTIIQPIDRMADQAVDMLIHRIKDSNYGFNTVFPVQLWRGGTV